MTKNKRQQFFVDPSVQTAMLRRLLIYWGCVMLFISLPWAIIASFLDPQRLFVAHLFDVWQRHWQVFLTMLLVLPFAINDMIRFSNRFVGPVFRLRRELRSFMHGGPLRTFSFRQNDFWADLNEGVNYLVTRLHEHETPQAEVPGAETLDSQTVDNEATAQATD